MLEDAALEGSTEEDEAAAAGEALLDPLPVGISPSRMQPVLSVNTFGQVICL